MELAARTELVLGTQVEIQLPAHRSSSFSDCFRELARIEAAFSRFLPTSELSRLNARLGVWQPASDELLALVERAEQFRAKTGGHFDISQKERLERMGYGPKPSAPSPGLGDAGASDPSHSPSPLHALARSMDPSALLRPFSPAIRLDRAGGRILLNKQIEFGGLGKGYALDRVAAVLDGAGVGHYCINAGGDLYAKRGAGGDPWPVLLEHPDDSARAIGHIELSGRSIAGSAPNRRVWGGGRFHHLLNAKTGKPAQGVKAIFVLAPTGIEADAYATALFSAGFYEGIEMARALGVEILFISSEGEMYQSPGFAAHIYD